MSKQQRPEYIDTDSPYFGGHVETFDAEQTGEYYFDFSSAYPAVMNKPCSLPDSENER